MTKWYNSWEERQEWGRPPDCYCLNPIFRVVGVTYLIEAREIRGLDETRAMRGW